MSAARGEPSGAAATHVVETTTVLQAVNPAGLATAGLQMILQIERDARRARSVSELQFLMANETRRAVGARQIFVLQQECKVVAVSSLSAVDRQSPVVRWIERCFAVVVATAPAAGKWQQNLRQLTDSGSGQDETARIFPFPEMIAASVVTPHGKVLGAVVAVRETVFNENETVVLQRLCETYGHAWAALGGAKPSLTARLRRPVVWATALCAIVGLGFIPVSMTALAPAEVVPLEPSVIAAPIDGAIEHVLIDPNQAVKTGDVLFRYADTQSRGALDVAEREVSVAEARLRQASQMAFVDPAAKRELAVARTEYRLKKAEHAFAADMHERTVVRAPKDGIAVFADKRELIGRPVSTGQRVMELADPARTQFRFQVPADDALVLKEGAVARVFMDSDPLNPLSATITRAAPMVKQNESGALAFRADAVLQERIAMPSLGHRGTAQISGDKVSLAFYLFRRPLAALRQRTGL